VRRLPIALAQSCAVLPRNRRLLLATERSAPAPRLLRNRHTAPPLNAVVREGPSASGTTAPAAEDRFARRAPASSDSGIRVTTRMRARGRFLVRIRLMELVLPRCRVRE
jgi:hypothetical protein